MRLFIALPLPEKAEQFLGNIIDDLIQKRGKVKWVDSKNIHLTLKFLGETDEQYIDDISTAIKKTATKHSSIKSTINKINGFPNLNRPRVIWAGLEDIDDCLDKLENIALDIDNEMSVIGFEKENKKFKSHLTLGRVKDNKNIGELTKYLETYRIQPQAVLFDKIVLFKSTLTPQGAIYERLYQADLGEFVFE
ncbi:MAG: RNA 2',3'-cyclic phosphodiesterase [candidate division Zixibacteria bacterium]|nr:RNA 2',3'-cyclic phosphodiesterase [candidate division Zixibacteria bacterium]